MPTPTFGQWLKARRSALDLTRAQVASQIGCAEITLGKIERGQRRPSKQIAALLAQALSIPNEAHDDFIRFARGEGEPPAVDGSRPRPRMVVPLTDLPAPLTSFVDRVDELNDVRDRLLRPDVRLLTLVGPPGIGKTRLAIQAGQTVLDGSGQAFADGVWFVSLAPISDPELVLPTIASTFNIAEGGPVPLLERLQVHLRPRQMLLILDNFEQVLDAAARVTALLKVCPGMKVLATSRVPLRVYGEHEYAMPALTLPPKGAHLSPQQLSEFDAVRLFVTRVQAFRPDFQLDADNAQTVVDVCARADGMPLAIELAASRLRRFTPQQLRDALWAAPLLTLVADARDAEPRQRTLRSAIQWSYDLLSAEQRAVFARLGVFVGGCTTAAALVVCELRDDTLLHILADQNLLKRESGVEGESRWTMLEMIREFALEQLTGDALTQMRYRHAQYFARIFEATIHAVDSGESSRVMDVEQHNARAALRSLIDLKDAGAGGLVLALGNLFDQRGLQTEGRRWLHEVLSADIELTPRIRNDLLGDAAIFAWQQHDFEEALRYMHECLAVSRTMDAPDSQPMSASALIALSHIYIKMGESDQAKTAALEALQIGRAVQRPVSIAGALDHLGEVELTLGNVDQAEASFTEAYALCQAPDWRHPVFAGLACAGMGEVALCHRDYDHALEFLREGLRRDLVAVNQLWILSLLAAVIGTMPRRTTADVCRAAKIWGATEVLNEKMGTAFAPDFRRRMDLRIAEARSRIDPRKFAAAWAEGRDLSLEEAIALAMA